MKKKATIYDIAQQLNVTVSTVSRALSGFPAISSTTRNAVLEVAKQLNYSPNKLASALKSGKTFIVGVIVPSIEIYFFASVIHSIEERLKESGYRIILYQSKESIENEILGVKTLMEARVDGIIASMSLETNNFSHFHEIVNQNIPLVLFDRVSHDINAPKVLLDDVMAGYIATKHLLEQGFRNIALLTTKHQVNIFKNRLAGYKKALLEYNLVVDDRNIIFGGLSIDDGIRGVEQLFLNSNPPDAIVAGDDFTALGVIKKLTKLNMIPPKVGVIGFSDEALSAHITPQLSSINQQAAKMGDACANIFLQISKGEKSTTDFEDVIIEPLLVERDSTQKK